MPIVYTIDPDARLVRYTVEGCPDHKELTLAARGLLGDPRFSIEYDMISDYSHADPSAITSGEIVDLAQALRARLDSDFPPDQLRSLRNRFAVVAPRAVVHGLMRMFEMHARVDAGRMRIFPDLPSAEKWIDEGRSGTA